jgi:hypothetical protein
VRGVVHYTDHACLVANADAAWPTSHASIATTFRGCVVAGRSYTTDLAQVTCKRCKAELVRADRRRSRPTGSPATWKTPAHLRPASEPPSEPSARQRQLAAFEACCRARGAAHPLARDDDERLGYELDRARGARADRLAEIAHAATFALAWGWGSDQRARARALVAELRDVDRRALGPALRDLVAFVSEADALAARADALLEAVRPIEARLRSSALVAL